MSSQSEKIISILTSERMKALIKEAIRALVPIIILLARELLAS